jgi:hypothetical protein
MTDNSEFLALMAGAVSDIGPYTGRRRAQLGIGLRQAAREAGTSCATLLRAERGHPLNQATVVILLRWLAKRAE